MIIIIHKLLGVSGDTSISVAPGSENQGQKISISCGCWMGMTKLSGLVTLTERRNRHKLSGCHQFTDFYSYR